MSVRVLSEDLREKRGHAFGSTAKAYDKGRPEFSKTAVDWLMAQLSSQERSTLHAVDIGAGTGMWTEHLVKSGLEVTAVEPSLAMLQALSEKLPQVRTFNRPAEDTGVEEKSADLITLSLCWHWLDADRACQEIDRLLKPNGVVALIWNLFDDSIDWVRPIICIYGSPVTFDMVEKHHRPQLTAGLQMCDEFEHKWTKRLSRADLETYCFSTSHYVTQTKERQKQLIEELMNYWDQCEATRGKDSVDMPFVTRITLIRRAADIGV